MRIAFHSNQLGERGTEVALFDYALFNRDYLGNESFIISDARTDDQSLYKFKEEFPVYRYLDFSEVERCVEKNKIDAIYFIKSGFNDGKLVKGCKNLVHAVFKNNSPHGDKYLYISKWLANEMTDDPTRFVPHMVNLPKSDNYREYLGIPKSAIVYGRYGGFGDFDNRAAQRAVIEMAKKYPDRYFLFTNTDHFLNSKDFKNISFFSATVDLNVKASFIDTCDCMIYGRNRGESFGLAIAEFLSKGKPVIANYGDEDLAHHDLLGNKNKIYSSFDECLTYLETFPDWKDSSFDYSSLVSEYTPEKVMDQFNQKFLQ